MKHSKKQYSSIPFPTVGDTVLVNRASEKNVSGNMDAHANLIPTNSQDFTTVEAVYMDGSVRVTSGDVWNRLIPSPDARAQFLAIS